MNKKSSKDPVQSRQVQPLQWKGEAVADAPDGEAEAAAARAEGRGATPRRPPGRVADDIVDGPRHTAKAMPPEEEEENQKEKREAAAEDHARDRAAGTGTAPKNL